MVRREDIEEQLNKDYELLKKLEDRQRTETDPKLEFRLNEDIGKLKQQIDNRQKELETLSTSSVPNQNVEDIKNSDKESSKVNMTFNAPVYGVAGNVQGNQNVYASEQKQPLAGEEIQDVHKQQQKILILAAITHGLRLDKEIREIEEAIRRATKRDLFDIRVRTAVRPQDIRRAIAEEQPTIVHFCGHGLEDGNLVLEDDGGNNKPVAPEALASLFGLHADYVKCMLLNACYSEKPAEAISEHIDYVIGMNNTIQDRAAIEFAIGFYDGLGFNRLDNQDWFKRAFDEAMVAIQMENLSQGQRPVLKKKALKQTSRSEQKSSTYEPPSKVPPQKIDIFFSKVAQRSVLLGITALILFLIFLFKSPLKSPLKQTDVTCNKASEVTLDYKPLSEIPITGDKASEVEADYTKLRDFLDNKEYAKADLETLKMILWVAKQEQYGRLRRSDLENFPSTDLRTINQLWLAASNGQFGFSVQKQIFSDCGGLQDIFDEFLFERFREKVEWAEGEIVYDQRAAKGHLPVGVYVNVSRDQRLSDKYWSVFAMKVIDEERKISKERKEEIAKKEDEILELRRQLAKGISLDEQRVRKRSLERYPRGNDERIISNEGEREFLEESRRERSKALETLRRVLEEQSESLEEEKRILEEESESLEEEKRILGFFLYCEYFLSRPDL